MLQGEFRVPESSFHSLAKTIFTEIKPTFVRDFLAGSLSLLYPPPHLAPCIFERFISRILARSGKWGLEFGVRDGEQVVVVTPELSKCCVDVTEIKRVFP